jgi:hypothetical protein
MLSTFLKNVGAIFEEIFGSTGSEKNVDLVFKKY